MLLNVASILRANIIQHDTFKSGKVNTESVAKPAVHRPGAEGKATTDHTAGSAAIPL